MEDKAKLKIIDSQIRQCFGRIAWTHKTQEKCADILNKRNSNFKLIQIVLSALVTSGIILQFLSDTLSGKIITALLSLALLILNTYLKKYDLVQAAQNHADCATDLWDIRESYLSLLVDIHTNSLSLDSIIERRDNLQEKLHSIYKGSPRSISKAYDKASKALKTNEELTLSNEEIDIFLPEELTKIKSYLQ